MTTSSPSLTRLLVVDDDLVQRRLIARIAVQAGHEVIEAASVAETEARLAEACAEGRPVDCVTVDLCLADGAGADVLHLVTEKCPHAQMLLITGATGWLLEHTIEIARENAIEIYDIVMKPIDLVALRASLWRAREMVWARRDAA
jgi:DNA-binding NtrC family response regulator